jgi:putative transposase
MTTYTPLGYRISDALWDKIEPLLPEHVNTHRFGGGRPRRPDRDCMDAIFYVLRTGCQWKALDETDLCPGSTAHDRFQEWVQAGVFERLWQASLEEYDEVQGLDWSWMSLDGAMTKAPLGGEKNREKPYGSGQTGHQAQPADRGEGCGRGRGQPQRLQNDARNSR